MSVVSYNGVTLPYARITSFAQDAVYEESNTDRIYTKFDVSIETLVNTDYLAMLAPDLVGGAFGSPAQIMNVIRSRLLEQRQPLSITFNGVQLIPQAQTGNQGTVDAKNGPRPISIACPQLSNTTFLVNWRVEAHYWENNLIVNPTPGASTPNGVTNQKAGSVLANRWTEQVYIDGCMRSRHVRHGKYVIRSDNALGQIVDYFRTAFAVCGVPDGFLRESAEYTVSPDGLSLEYNIVDQEVFKLPPSPAFIAEGEYTERTGKGGGWRTAEARVLLKSTNQVSQALLLQTAIGVVTLKLAVNGAANQQGTSFDASLVQEGSIRLGLYDNWVECNIRVLCPGGRNRFNGVALGTDNDGTGIRKTFTPGSDSGTAPSTGGRFFSPVIQTSLPYQDRGTYSLLLLAAAYYDPSILNASLQPTTTTNPTSFGTPAYSVKAQIGPNLPIVGTLGKNT